MPEIFIIYCLQYKDNIIKEWWKKLKSLSEKQLEEAKEIIGKNKFKFNDENYDCSDKAIIDVLTYYNIKRETAEKEAKYKEK